MFKLYLIVQENKWMIAFWLQSEVQHQEAFAQQWDICIGWYYFIARFLNNNTQHSENSFYNQGSTQVKITVTSYQKRYLN